MAGLTKTEIAALSRDERLALIGDLWESLGAPQDAAMDVRHRQIVEQRLTEYDPVNDDLLSLDQVCARMRAR
jgi:putative addiction module component (TIGR02574 family)